MELQVYKNTTLREVKEKFSHYFPFLQLEFYVYEHHTEDRQPSKAVYKGLYLEETSDFFKEGTIHFSSSTSVGDLEQKFQIELGLVAKVFRKSGESWIDTTQTNHLSLGRQNNMGAVVTRHHFNLHTLSL